MIHCVTTVYTNKSASVKFASTPTKPATSNEYQENDNDAAASSGPLIAKSFLHNHKTSQPTGITDSCLFMQTYVATNSTIYDYNKVVL